MAWSGELRDCSGWATEGLPLTTQSSEAARLFDAALRQHITFTDCEALGGLEETLRKLLVADPEFVLGKAIQAGVELLGTGNTTRLDPRLTAEVEELRVSRDGAGLSSRERRHADAVIRLGDGDWPGACALWERILAQHPGDLLALKFAYDAYFDIGQRGDVRDVVARTLPHCARDSPLFGHLKGMLAFGLEENGELAEAERVGRAALALNAGDGWATHALAHVFDARGQAAEGIRLLSSGRRDWEACGGLACHNHWHWAVSHLELGEAEAALDVFDAEVGSRAAASGGVGDIVDASSLLLRLEMEGVHVGPGRWAEVAELCRPHLHDHILAFNDAHFVMGLAGAGRAEDVDQLGRSLSTYVAAGVGGNAELSRRLGQPLLAGIRDFLAEDYAEAAEALWPLGPEQLRPLGGSGAQRDVFELIRIQAHLRSPDVAQRRRLPRLLAAREARRPNSKLTARLRAHFQEGHLGDD